jgi:DNA modification methylase
MQEYRRIEKRYSVIDARSSLSNLVRANGSLSQPIQRWYRLKEAFSIELLEELLEAWRIDPSKVERVLDPFCGVGTTLLALQRLAKDRRRKDLEGIGIERNPFLHFVSNTKLRWADYDPKAIRDASRVLGEHSASINTHSVPALSTLGNSQIFEPSLLNDLLDLRETISTHFGDDTECAPILLAYASILENVSGARKDGRALRIEPKKQRPAVSVALKMALQMTVEDIEAAGQFYSPIPTQVLKGDGRTLQMDDHTSKLGVFDIIFYSPPYLNNIDYTEVYKIELWMTGFIDNLNDFRALRKSTFRSHPSVRFPGSISLTSLPAMEQVCQVIETLVEALPIDENLRWRSRLFWEYFDDMYQALHHQVAALRPGGWIFCVVGNSLHGSAREPHGRVPVAADLIIALIAESLGLEVKGIQIGRTLIRRSPLNPFSRESVLAFRAP